MDVQKTITKKLDNSWYYFN